MWISVSVCVCVTLCKNVVQNFVVYSCTSYAKHPPIHIISSRSPCLSGLLENTFSTSHKLLIRYSHYSVVYIGSEWDFFTAFLWLCVCACVKMQMHTHQSSPVHAHTLLSTRLLIFMFTHATVCVCTSICDKHVGQYGRTHNNIAPFISAGSLHQLTYMQLYYVI